MAPPARTATPGTIGRPVVAVAGVLTLVILGVRPLCDAAVYPGANEWLITTAVLAGILTTIAVLLGGTRAARVSRLGTIAVAAWLFWAGASVTWSVDPGYTIRQWFDLLAAVCLWWAALHIGSDVRWRAAGAVVLTAGLVATCAYGFYEYFVIRELVRREVFANMQRWIGLVAMDRLYSNRIASTFLAPNSFADYLSNLLPISIAVAISRQGRAPRGRSLAQILAAWAIVVLAIACLVLTASRGGWLAAVVACGLLAVWPAGRWILGTRAVTMVLMAGMLVLALPLRASTQETPAVGEDRDSTSSTFTEGMDPAYWRGGLPTVEELLSGSTLRIRATYWRGTLAMWRDHPWFGVGWGAWPSAYPRYTVRGGYPTQLAHNNYLQILAELGPIGLTCFLVALGSALWSGWRHTRLAPTPAARWLWAGATCSVVAFAVHSLTDFALYAPSISWISFAVLGLLHGAPAGTAAPKVAPRRLWACAAAAGGMVLLWFWLSESGSAQLVREARAVARSGRLEAALTLAREAADQVPWDGEAAALAGRLTAQLASGNQGPGWTEALGLLHRAARLKPLDPWIQQSLADALWQAGTVRRDPAMFQEALQAYAAAVANYPVNPALRATLARAARALGDEATATREFAAAEELRPDYREPLERQ